MGSKFDFIVQVLGGEVEMAPAFRGTGLLIASDRVLTCRHVVMEQIPYGQPTDAPLPQLWVQRAAGPRLLVEKPVLAANWDLAVLELAGHRPAGRATAFSLGSQPGTGRKAARRAPGSDRLRPDRESGTVVAASTQRPLVVALPASVLSDSYYRAVTRWHSGRLQWRTRAVAAR